MEKGKLPTHAFNTAFVERLVSIMGNFFDNFLKNLQSRPCFIPPSLTTPPKMGGEAPVSICKDDANGWQNVLASHIKPLIMFARVALTANIKPNLTNNSPCFSLSLHKFIMERNLENSIDITRFSTFSPGFFKRFGIHACAHAGCLC